MAPKKIPVALDLIEDDDIAPEQPSKAQKIAHPEDQYPNAPTSGQYPFLFYLFTFRFHSFPNQVQVDDVPTSRANRVSSRFQDMAFPGHFTVRIFLSLN
jgi:hypothetical protein